VAMVIRRHEYRAHLRWRIFIKDARNWPAKWSWFARVVSIRSARLRRTGLCSETGGHM